MNDTVRVKPILALAAAATLGAGCASTTHLKDAETHYYAGEYKAAAESARARLSGLETPEERGTQPLILDNLYAGAASFMAGDEAAAAEAFERAAEGIAEQDDSTFGSGYPTRTYDVSMAANYKALALWADGDVDGARVAFRLTADAQERADDRNARAIRKAEDEAEQRKADETAKAESDASEKGGSAGGAISFFMNALSTGDVKKEVDDFVGEYSSWSVYDNFQVPSTWFLDGLFALANAEMASDLEHASYASRKALGMLPSAPAKRVYDFAEARADGKIPAKALDKVFAVVFENGLGPEIEERRFDIPVPYEGRVYMLSFALPKLVRRDAAYPKIVVRSGAVSLGETVPVAELDKVVVREFKSRLPGIVASQIFEAVVKVAVQAAIVKAVEQKGGAQAAFLVSLATSAASSALTGTDTRHWNLLPKDIQAFVWKKPKTKNREIELWVPGAVQPLAKVALPEKGLSVVYVKVPAPGLPPLVKILGEPAK